MDHVSVARRVPPTLYAQSAGAKIAYQVSGEGRCDLVVVPGLVSHLELQWQQPAYRRFVTAPAALPSRGGGLSHLTTHRSVEWAAQIVASAGAPPSSLNLEAASTDGPVTSAIVVSLSDEVQECSRGKREQGRRSLIAARETGLPAVWLAGPCRVDADRGARHGSADLPGR